MQLLVSVRSVAEADAALEGGADVIDVKEPSHGSLGRADDPVIAGVIRTVAGRRPVTAAMGELVQGDHPCSVAGLTWVKWGLASVVRTGLDWQVVLRDLRRSLAEPGLVAVAYADAVRAGSPPVEKVCHFACGDGMAVLLLDTWKKDGTTLLDWLAEPQLREVCDRCRLAGVRVALAGSLDLQHLRTVRGLGASILAVRGAVCTGGTREGLIDAIRVRALARALA